MNVKILFIQETNCPDSNYMDLSGTVIINEETVEFETTDNGLLCVIDGPDIDSILLTNIVKDEMKKSGYVPRKSSMNDLLGAEFL